MRKSVKTRGPGVILLALLLFFVNLKAEKKEWTLLIYMAADNSLTESADLDLKEIENGGYPANTNVVIEVDRAFPSIETNTVVYVLSSDGLIKIKDLGELDTGSPEVLRDFILWGISSFPAKRFGLVLWGHGKSWDKSTSFVSPRFFGNDYSSGNSIDVYNGELSLAIPDSILDFILFDGCMMGGIEVLSELFNKAHYVVASPALVPVFGFPYDSLIGIFDRFGSYSTLKILQEICDDYISESSEYETSLSITIFDMRSLNSVLSYLKQVASVLTKLSDDSLEVWRQKAFGYSVINPEVRDSLSPYVDLKNYLEYCGFNSQAVFDSFVIYHSASGIYKNTGGLHIWYPVNEYIFEREYFNYRKLSFEKFTRWSDVIISTYGEEFLQSLVIDSITLKKTTDGVRVSWGVVPLKENWRYSVRLENLNNGNVKFHYVIHPKITLKLLPGNYSLSVGVYDPDENVWGIYSPNVNFVVEPNEIELYPDIITSDFMNFQQFGIKIFTIDGKKVKFFEAHGVYIIKSQDKSKKIIYVK